MVERGVCDLCTTLMDCNMRSPMQWDWENLFMYNSSQTESHKKQLSIECGVERGEGIESVVPSFSGFEGFSSGSDANFWNSALSKSPQSNSGTSSSPEVKTYKLSSECIPEDSCSNIEFEQVKASPAVEVSVGSAESFLGLKLGKRTYFEDFCGGNNNDISAVSVKLASSVAMTKSNSSVQVSRCQVEGCELDLSSAKDYHRKHRVCESHSKCPKVIVGGLERRFCQQCSRFHAISEFDEKKRSCRKRLSHHNARRRKPQGAFPLNPAAIYAADRREQHTNAMWNELSLNTRTGERYTYGGESGFTLSFERGNGAEQQLFSSSSSNSLSTVKSVTTGFSGGKSSLIGFQNAAKGGEGKWVKLGGCEGQQQEGFNMHHQQQQQQRALSLLSTTSTSRDTNHLPFSDSFPNLFF